MASGFGNGRGFQLAASVLVAAILMMLVRVTFGAGWTEAAAFALPLAILTSPVSFSTWYLCKALPLSRTPVVRLIVTVAVASAVSGGIWASVGYGWRELMPLVDLPEITVDIRVLTALLAGLGSLGYLLSVAANYLLQAFEESAEASRRVLASDVAHRDAELRALRAQIDPHFLFNSLNSVAALTTADPVRAREMCQLLADFLRESLAVGGAQQIPLGREVGLAEQYLRVEQVRFGRRLEVRASVTAEGAACSVPPLILQPLVENAVRHGIATRLEGGTIEISAQRSGDRAIIEVRNPRDADEARPGTGRGLDLVRRRLHTMFGDRAALSIEATQDAYRVRLSVPAGGETR